MTLARTMLVVAAVIALMGAPASRAADSASAEDITVRVETRGSTVIIDVELPISVSPEEAWPTLIDYDHMSDFIPDLTHSRVLTRDGNRLRVVQKGKTKRAVLAFSFENVRDVVLVPPHEIRTTLVSGSLKSADSLTRIERTASGSRLVNHGEYTVSALLPLGLVTHTIASEAREQFALMRAEIMRRHAQVASAR
jgi:hypothetical protein